jgi:hypothetical protein
MPSLSFETSSTSMTNQTCDWTRYELGACAAIHCCDQPTTTTPPCLRPLSFFAAAFSYTTAKMDIDMDIDYGAGVDAPVQQIVQVCRDRMRLSR